MKIGITSASGHLATSVIKELTNRIGNNKVVAIARSPQKVSNKDIETRIGDYNSYKDFEEALKGINSLLLISGNDEPEKRIGQHKNIIDAAKVNGVRKIVYTSILGGTKKTAFNPIIQSNRKTEKDIQNSGLLWSIGRNGLYIEPDLEYIENYKKVGYITNSAGEGKCAYTSRNELARVYSSMLLDDKHNGKIYNLVGNSVTQYQLAETINQIYGLNLTYKPMSTEEFLNDRIDKLGNFIGSIIGGIYEGISFGEFDSISDFKNVLGRNHKSLSEMITEYRLNE